MQVLEDLQWESMQQVVDTLPKAEYYCSDQSSIYPDLEWPEGSSHIISKGKEQTHTIESLNANLRHYLKRLARKTRCFSRCFKALERSVRLFAWYYNRRQRIIIARGLTRYQRSGLPPEKWTREILLFTIWRKI
jgi:insertion element IS1 protein InsB